MILRLLKTLYEFVAPVMPIKMSPVDHSVGPQKEQWMLSKHTLMDLLQLYHHRTLALNVNFRTT
jgi:hypothetical protein